MQQFVQIGTHAYNVDEIREVHFKDEDHIILQYKTDRFKWTELKYKEAQSFRQWWDEHAPVYRCALGA